MFNKKLLIALVATFVIISGGIFSLATVNPSIPDLSKFEVVTIEELVSAPKLYNRKKVRVEGRVEEVDYTSHKGNPFTIFRLKDDNSNELRVYYKYEHLPISSGDRVEIMGRYREKRRWFFIKIKNIVKAKVVNIISVL